MSYKKNLTVSFLKVFLISLFVAAFFMGFGSSCDPEKGDKDFKAVYDEEGNYLGKEERTYDGENWVDSGIVVSRDLANETGIDETGNHVKIETEKVKKYKWDKNKEKYVLVESTMDETVYNADDSIKTEDYKWDNEKEDYILTKTEVIPTDKKERKPTVMVNLNQVRPKEPATKEEIKETKGGTTKAENAGVNTGGGGDGGGGGGGHP